MRLTLAVLLSFIVALATADLRSPRGIRQKEVEARRLKKNSMKSGSRSASRSKEGSNASKDGRGKDGKNDRVSAEEEDSFEEVDGIDESLDEGVPTMDAAEAVADALPEPKPYQTMDPALKVTNYEQIVALRAAETSDETYEELNGLVDKIRKSYVETWPIAVEEIWKMFPIAPDDYPEALQGVMWMDQEGYYGHSDVGQAAPESLLTLGESRFSTYDGNNFLFTSGSCGGAWALDGTPQGVQWRLERCGDRVHTGLGGPVRRFIFSDDMETAYIDAYVVPQEGRNGIYAESARYKAVMYRQHPPEGACPPSVNATKMERNVCAKWIRESYLIDNQDLTGETSDYPVFEIVGQDGLPVEPYFSAYVEAMKARGNTHSHMGMWLEGK